METFYEQLYKKKKVANDYLLQIGIMVASVILSAAMVMLFPAFIPGFGLAIALFASMGLFYLVITKVLIKIDVEYEYIYLSGELDVDKIFSKSERTRLVTVKAINFDRFGMLTPENESKVKQASINKTIDVRSNTGKQLYYAIFNHKEYKRTLLIFEPNDEILEDLKKYIPREALM